MEVYFVDIYFLDIFCNLGPFASLENSNNTSRGLLLVILEIVSQPTTLLNVTLLHSLSFTLYKEAKGPNFTTYHLQLTLICSPQVTAVVRLDCNFKIFKVKLQNIPNLKYQESQTNSNLILYYLLLKRWNLVICKYFNLIFQILLSC